MTTSASTKIIGLSGTNGSGKDTVGNLLAQYHGYLFISMTDLLRDELKKRGLEIIRKNMRALSAEWRRQSGLGILIDMAVELYNQAPGKYSGVVMASLRNPGEADRIHELRGVVVWIDADSRLRYQRIRDNAAVRNRHGEDNKTYEQFLEEEEAEMHKPRGGDEATLNTYGVKSLSDYTLINESNDLKSLLRQLEKTLKLPLKP